MDSSLLEEGTFSSLSILGHQQKPLQYHKHQSEPENWLKEGPKQGIELLVKS